jgi:putative copper resistance protein D
MLEAAIVVARLLQYLGAAVLFGSSLFFVFALPREGPGSARETRWARPLLLASAVVLALSALLAIAAQASLFAGSFEQGLATGAIGDVVRYMDLGKAAAVRTGAAVLAMFALTAIARGRASWLAAAALGALAAVSLAWMGHGAATEGPLHPLHLASDVLHALAACAWLGALAAFVPLALGTAPRGVLLTALRRFSAIGPFVVAVLVLTGAVNAWVLVGLDNLGAIAGTPYGRVLLAKLGLFAVMLALAAANRFRHTPALADDAPLSAIRRSLAVEAGAGLGVLGLVAWLGTLAPPGLAA